MTEKEYKLEQWTDNSLYYSFPNGNLHHSISNVLTRVEKDLNALHEENQSLKQSFDLINKVRKELIEENEQLKLFVEYEKRQHKHWKRECLENIKEIAQLKREIVQLKGDVE